MSPLERKSAPAARLALASDLAYDSIALAHALHAGAASRLSIQTHRQQVHLDTCRRRPSAQRHTLAAATCGRRSSQGRNANVSSGRAQRLAGLVPAQPLPRFVDRDAAGRRGAARRRQAAPPRGAR